MSYPSPAEFNDEVKRAIDWAIFGIIGQESLGSLYKTLKDHHDISPEEIPYRLDTLFDTLEHTFGVAGAKTIGRAIAKRFYFRFNLKSEPKSRLQTSGLLGTSKKATCRTTKHATVTEPDDFGQLNRRRIASITPLRNCYEWFASSCLT